MPQLGTMVNAGVASFPTPNYYPQFLQIGNFDDANILDSLECQLRGQPVVSLGAGNSAVLAAIATLDNPPLIAAGASVIPAGRIRLAKGEIQDERAFLSLGNAGATTPPIYGYSIGTDPSKTVRRIGQDSIQINQNTTYTDFEFCIFDPANVVNVEVQYINGFVERLTIAELEALFASSYPTQANLLINGLLVVAGRQNPKAPIRGIRIFNGAGATLVTTTRYIPLT